MPGVVLVNPRSGPDETEAADLRGRFPAHRVVECEGDQLRDEVRRALETGAEFVAVAGGDGSVRVAASLLAGSGVPLLAVPTGTRNHFARELGIETPDDAVAAATRGERRSVDLAEVNGERFVNNSSIGFYAALVRERDRHERRLPKAAANLSAAWAQARRGHRFRVRVDGRPYRAWLVFVGNGCYGDTITSLTNRESLDERLLDVRVLRADVPLARARAVIALLLNRLGRSSLLVRRTTREVEVDVRTDEADVALDGEVVRLDGPLLYRSLPGALTVLVPPSEGPAAGGKVG